MLAAALSVSGAPASAAPVDTDSTSSTARFTVSSFNVLGTSHTVHSREYASGPTRVRWGAKLLANHSTDVVGFNELQSDQLRAYLAATDGRFGIYPGDKLLERDSNNSIAWRKSMWEPISLRTFEIPYHHGIMRAMPVIKLRHRASGQAAYFINVHNPATNKKHPGARKYRIRATTIEIDLVNRLKSDGLPIFVLGDMNDRDYYFCRMTGEAPMKAARGGYNRDGVCDAERPRSVSWIFGSKPVGFSNYIEAEGAFVQKITDHRVLFSDVGIDRANFSVAASK